MCIIHVTFQFEELSALKYLCLGIKLASIAACTISLLNQVHSGHTARAYFFKLRIFVLNSMHECIVNSNKGHNLPILQITCHSQKLSKSLTIKYTKHKLTNNPRA